MTREVLQARIDKVNSKIEKIEAKAKRLTYGLTEEEIQLCKNYEQAPFGTKPRDVAYWDYHGTEAFQEATKKFKEYVAIHPERQGMLNELRSVYISLCDVKVTKNKYQNALNKLNQFDSAEKIPVIWEFLQNWKESAKEYYHFELNRLKEMYDWYHEQFEKYANKPEYRQEYKDFYEEYHKRLKGFDKVTKDLYAIHNEQTREQELNNILDKEVRAKYERLVNDVVAITGPITDAGGLHVSPKGELNGYIIGEQGKAHIETIMAGGYNQNIVNPETGRRGQILHYRTLINPIKQKIVD